MLDAFRTTLGTVSDDGGPYIETIIEEIIRSGNHLEERNDTRILVGKFRGPENLLQGWVKP